jgi:predicted transposase/invertase (TIGR01784 family)
VISYWHLREKESLLKYSDDIELIFVELPKFTKTLEELETLTDKWIYFLRNAGKLDIVPKTLSVEPHLAEAFQIANIAGLSEEEHEIQFKQRDFIWLQQGSIRKAKKEGLEIGRLEGRQQGRLEGRQEGKLEGRQEGKLEVARNLLKQGISLEIVMTCTGFTEAELLGGN